MNNRELRRGNVVKQGFVDDIGETKAYCYPPKIGASIFQKLSGDHYSYEEIKPIPLDEAILKALGFRKEGEWAVLYFDPRMGIRFYNWNCAECDIIQDDKFISFKNGHIKYVHELQNLYHALTGKEL